MQHHPSPVTNADFKVIRKVFQGPQYFRFITLIKISVWTEISKLLPTYHAHVSSQWFFSKWNINFVFHF